MHGEFGLSNKYVKLTTVNQVDAIPGTILLIRMSFDPSMD